MYRPKYIDWFKHKPVEWTATKLLGYRYQKYKHWGVAWLDALLVADAALLDHILKQDHSYHHYLCLVNIGSEHLKHKDPAELACMIRNRPMQEVLHVLFDPCPAGLLEALKKLPEGPIARPAYTRLVNLLSGNDSGRLLPHDSALSPIQRQLLEQLPLVLRYDYVVSAIQNKQEMDDFLAVINEMHRQYPALSDTDIAIALCASREPEDIWLNLTRLASDLQCKDYLLKTKFPAPPWPGNDWIKPVTNLAQLRSAMLSICSCAARIMCDCETDYYLHNIIEGSVIREYGIMDGGLYLYVSRQRPNTVVVTRKDRYGMWHLKDAIGDAGARLDEEGMADIVRRLQKAGFNKLEKWYPHRRNKALSDDHAGGWHQMSFFGSTEQ